MANLKIALTADTSGAVRNLDRVRTSLRDVTKQTDTTDAAFDRLRNTLAGIATGVFAASSFQMAQGLNDISKATGIALQNVVGFSQAIQANGGTIDRARDGLSDFTKNVSEAARGQRELQDALAKSGVSLQDLATLSEQDLLAKTIQGLSRIPDAATRSATAMKLFGESMKGVDLQGVAAGLGAFTANAGPNAEAIRAAGEASGNFQRVINDLQIQLLAALKPISELAVELMNAKDSIRAFVDVAIEIAKVLGIFFVVTKVIQGVVAAVALLARAPALVAAGWSTITKTFEIFVWQLGKIRSAGAVTQATINALGKRFAFLRQGIDMLSKGFGVLAVAIYGAYQAIKQFFGSSDTKGIEEAEAAIAAETEALKEGTHWTQKAREERERAAAALRQVTAATLAEEQAILKTVSAYQLAISASQQRYQTETDLIGASEQRRDRVQQLQEAETAYLTQIQGLMDQYAAKSQSNNASDLAMLPKIEQAIQSVTEAYSDQISSIEANTEARARATAARQQELFVISQQQQAEDALQKIQREIADVTLTDIEKKYQDIRRAADDSARAAIRAEEARRGAPLSTAEVDEYYRVARSGVDQLIAKQRELNEVNRSWNTGWKNAVNEYVEDATNGARAAENIFKKTTQGMEDAIMDFAKTGKFEFKSFINSIIQEMLRSQVQQLIAKTFGSFGGGGSSSIGRLLGFADGGLIPTNRPVLVGEAGPEIITGAGGRTVIPNNQLGGGSTAITYNISAVDAVSFQQLVARDPQFMYAVTEQGRRSMPTGRR